MDVEDDRVGQLLVAPHDLAARKALVQHLLDQAALVHAHVAAEVGGGDNQVRLEADGGRLGQQLAHRVHHALLFKS